jgi:DNA repair exonuclease SbcCD ATPase subunit
MEKKVLTQEEISEITQIKEKFENLKINIGEIETQIMSLQLKKEEFKTILYNIQQDEIKLVKKLEEKYGIGTISVETGEFSPTK